MRKVLLPNHYTVYVYVKCVYAPFMLLNGQEDQKNVSQYFKRFFTIFLSRLPITVKFAFELRVGAAWKSTLQR